MKNSERIVNFSFKIATLITVIAIILVFIMVIAFALPIFNQSLYAQNFGIFSWVWNPNNNQFGILPMISGSILLSITSVISAWILGLGLCCWTLTFKKTETKYLNLLHGLVIGLIRFMTSVPTVVYGFVAIFLLVPIIRSAFGGSGLCWFSASVILSLLLLPTIVLVMEAGLRPRLEQIYLTATSLGFNRQQTFCYFVLPTAKQSLLTAFILAFNRGIGDTLIALMLAGNAPQLPLHLSDSLRTLSAHIALVTSNEVSSMAYNSLFAAGAILLLINASLSITMRKLIKTD